MISGEFGVFVARGHVRGNGGGTQMFGTDDRIARFPNKPHSVHFEGGKATNTNRPKKCSPVAGGLPIMDGPESWRLTHRKSFSDPWIGGAQRQFGTLTIPTELLRFRGRGDMYVARRPSASYIAKRCPCQTDSDRGLTNHAVGF
jgi:hypothetical protein